MTQQTRQQMAAVISLRGEAAAGCGNRSRIPVMKPSTPTNWQEASKQGGKEGKGKENG